MPATAATTRNLGGWLRRFRTVAGGVRNHAATIAVSPFRNHAETGLKPTCNHAQPCWQNSPATIATCPYRGGRNGCAPSRAYPITSRGLGFAWRLAGRSQYVAGREH
jgi:hypothetical protein